MNDSVAPRIRQWLPPIMTALLLMTAQAGLAQQKNGFDLGNATVPAAEIRRGGPPRDGIPALNAPSFERPDQVDFWKPDDRLLLVDVGGVTFAYPIGILNWHEIVDHDAGGESVLVTFCPLCGTGVAFDANVDGRRLTFGVSGLLYDSDLLMYDHQTQSLWSQILGEAIAGPLVGTRLKRRPVRYATWGKWADRAVHARVLSTHTGYARDYHRSPYGGYKDSDRLLFPVSQTSRQYHPKTYVVGLTHAGVAKAWPFPELEKRDTPLADRIGDMPVVVHFDPSVPTATITTPAGEPLPAVQGFWFAWYTFHPHTAVFKANE